MVELCPHRELRRADETDGAVELTYVCTSGCGREIVIVRRSEPALLPAEVS
jgi:hypothetical protein